MGRECVCQNLIYFFKVLKEQINGMEVEYYLESYCRGLGKR